MDRTFAEGALPSSQDGDRARRARILCCITFHFVRRRLESLADVLQALAEFPVAFLEVVLVTNSIDESDASTLRRLALEIMGEGRATVCRVEGLDNPFDLAWQHKPIIAERFLGPTDSGFTHFLYLEDDIRFSFQNFEYFIAAREQLRDAGLLPAFVRTEWSEVAGGLVATDCFWPVYVPFQSSLRACDTLFLNMPNPYNPCFVLDRELACEHLASPLSDRLASSRLVASGIRERAAMGLCLENVPESFKARYVVPVSTDSNQVPSWARVRHLQGTYAPESSIGLGKTRLDRLFHGAQAINDGSWWPQCRRSDGASGFFLVTHHDTVVYFDWDTMQLRHGPFGVVPLNLTVQLADREAILNVESDTGRHRLVFRLEEAGDVGIGLMCDGNYASADADGLVRPDRTAMSDWERFGLMRCDTVSGIGLLAEHAWRNDADGSAVRLEVQPIAFWRWQASPASALAAGILRNTRPSRGGVAFGGSSIRLVAREPRLSFEFEEALGERRPTRALIVEDDGTVSSFSRVD
ncbi:MAG: hypothetical protein U1E60_19790 [Reyranellaceae bacterium]